MVVFWIRAFDTLLVQPEAANKQQRLNTIRCGENQTRPLQVASKMPGKVAPPTKT